MKGIRFGQFSTLLFLLIHFVPGKSFLQHLYQREIAGQEHGMFALLGVRPLDSNIQSNQSLACTGHTSNKTDGCSYTLKKEVFFYERDEDVFNNQLRYLSEMATFFNNNGRHIGRNDLCLCGSGVKYKKCCEEKYRQSQFIASMLRNKQTAWMKTRSDFVEKPVREFWGLEMDLPKSSKEIISGLRDAGAFKP